MTPALETGLRAVGTALAGLSIAFAGYMVTFGGGETRVNGMQYLAIFAQPRGAASVARSNESIPPTADGAAVDLATTSSIAAPDGNLAPTLRPVEILAARADRVWLRVDNSIQAAVPGDTVSGLGRIGAIVSRDGGWALLDDKGATLRTVAKRENSAPLFARKRIFE